MRLGLTAILFAAGFLGGAPPPPQTRSLAVVRTAAGQEVELYDQSHALIIGMSNYTAGWRKLPGVETDVVAVQKVLEAHGFSVQVERDLTRDGFDQVMRAFIAAHGLSARNRLVLYFAGHGHTQAAADGRQLGFIVPVDAPVPTADPGGFRARAVSMDQIEVYAREIESRHALMVFDSCFAGTLFDVSRALPGAIATNLEQPVRQFITSGTAGQEVPDTSEFRRQFVAGLEGEADLTNDGYISGTELGLYLEDRVASYTRQAQTPRFGKIRDGRLDKGDMIFLSPKAPSASPIYDGATPQPGARDRGPDDATYWEAIKGTKDRSALEDFLTRFPQSQYRVLAVRRLAELDREDPVAMAERWFEAVRARDVGAARALLGEPVRQAVPETTLTAMLAHPDSVAGAAERKLLYEERSADGKGALVIFLAGDQYQRLSLARDDAGWGAYNYRLQPRAAAVPATLPPYHDVCRAYLEASTAGKADEAYAMTGASLRSAVTAEQFRTLVPAYAAMGPPVAREVIYVEQDSPLSAFVIFKTRFATVTNFERLSAVFESGRWLVVAHWTTPAGPS